MHKYPKDNSKHNLNSAKNLKFGCQNDSKISLTRCEQNNY